MFDGSDAKVLCTEKQPLKGWRKVYPGKGSPIFLHCLGPYKPYTGGSAAIPREQLVKIMRNLDEDCVVVIDSLEKLSPETWAEWGL